MRLALRAVLLCGAISCTASACQTAADGSQPREPPPEIYANMPFEKVLAAGINHGGETLQQAKRLFKHRHENSRAHVAVQALLKQHHSTYEHHQLMNAAHLYIAMPGTYDVPLFVELVQSPRPLENQLGWQLAAAKPAPNVAAAAERELTRAVSENEEDTVLLPQMANAIAANHMRASYTMLRQGLLQKGNEEFARAMILLEPQRASEDFLIYLSLAGAEELRQMTVSSINMYSALLMLTHMQRMPPTISSPFFPNLFFYAVSRNITLADQAQLLLETYLPKYGEALAAQLARHPAWVQMAFLESARRRSSPPVTLFLSELKKVTAEEDVAREIADEKF